MSAENIIDIHSKGEYPSCELSNFHPHKFVFRGTECQSMEGLLQSLKTKNKEKQLKICKLYGKSAKNRFHRKFQNLWWKITGTLWWQGEKIKRCGEEYQHFLDEAYMALFENEEFKMALRASKGKKLTHSIGKQEEKKTVLTENEFITRLEKLRETV